MLRTDLIVRAGLSDACLITLGVMSLALKYSGIYG